MRFTAISGSIGIAFLMMTPFLQAADIDGSLKKLSNFANACYEAQKADDPSKLQAAKTEIQSLGNATGMSEAGSYQKYLDSLDRRLCTLREVTTIESRKTDEMRAKLNRISENFERIRAKVGISAQAESEVITERIGTSGSGKIDVGFEKDSETKRILQECIDSFGSIQANLVVGSTKESYEVITNQTACYAMILKEIGRERTKLEEEKNEESIKAIEGLIKSHMPNHDQIWACVLGCVSDKAKQLQENGHVTATGRDVFLKLQRDVELKSWLKNAVIVDGRTVEKSRCPNRLELVLSSTPGGPQEAAAIFFLEGNRIKFHDIWIEKGVLGRAEGGFVH